MLKRKWGVVLHGLLHDCIQPCYVVAKIAHVKTCFSLAQAVEPGNEARLVLINWSFFFKRRYLWYLTYSQELFNHINYMYPVIT